MEAKSRPEAGRKTTAEARTSALRIGSVTKKCQTHRRNEGSHFHRRSPTEACAPVRRHGFDNVNGCPVPPGPVGRSRSQGEPGHYQATGGPFPQWDEPHRATKAIVPRLSTAGPAGATASLEADHRLARLALLALLPRFRLLRARSSSSSRRTGLPSEQASSSRAGWWRPRRLFRALCVREDDRARRARTDD